jgi:diguanylate cyclase (GGDEF)-like protein
LVSWEQATSSFLDGIGLRSIRSKIIIFALSATLIPAVTMGWLSYRNNRRAIDEKIVQELTSLTSHASRDLELWFRERRYEIKVLASSYEVSENLEKLNRRGQVDGTGARALTRLEDYLGSIGGKFSDYEELIVLDVRGNVLASSRAQSGELGMAGDWLDRARANETIINDAYWDETFNAGVVVNVEPIRAADGSLLGAMGAKIKFDAIEKILASNIKDPSHELYLVTKRGEILIGSRNLEGPFMDSKLEAATAERLFTDRVTPLEFRSFHGNSVLGALRTIPGLAWGIVAEKDRAKAYAAITRLRNVTLALIATVLLAIGLAGYLLGLTIVGPLGRLTKGASKVAGGDLEVNLPLHGHSEVSYLTVVFNEMVGRLRKFRDENVTMNQELRVRNDELQKLSITDSLTGLYNRAQLSQVLAKELARSQRHLHPFSILMIDIDHFKRFNDTHGHQAGDDMLRRVAEIIRSSLRASDVAARYGGEEFLILLTETEPEKALHFADRLRSEVEGIRSQDKKTATVSVGVASFPDDGDDVESIIREADVALYRCKRRGRNQVALASASRQHRSQSRAS